MGEWLYRLTENERFPEPLEEIAALAALDEEGKPTYLMLQEREDAAGKTATHGDAFLLCLRGRDGALRVHAEAMVKDAAVLGATPTTVVELYGEQSNRWFVPLERVVQVEARPAPLTPEESASFLKGQAGVRKLQRDGKSPRRAPAIATAEAAPVTFARLDMSHYDPPPFRVLGLDPTAGAWASHMTANVKKAMPSVALAWTGREIVFEGVALHTENAEFWARVRELGASLVCIDGPCQTNGLRVLPGWTGWDESARGGTRDGEVELTKAGVGLFWTTHATVTRFKGASEWIARALRLFDEAHASATKAIETHPHGAFTFLWRQPGAPTNLPKKKGPAGRAARLAMLRAFIPTLEDAALRDHDAVDAAAAALVAVLHRLGATKSFGTEGGGGLIWMPVDAVRPQPVAR